MVAIAVFDQDVLRGCLDADALVSICHFKVVKVAVVSADQVNAVGATNIGATS